MSLPREKSASELSLNEELRVEAMNSVSQWSTNHYSLIRLHSGSRIKRRSRNGWVDMISSCDCMSDCKISKSRIIPNHKRAYDARSATTSGVLNPASAKRAKMLSTVSRNDNFQHGENCGRKKSVLTERLGNQEIRRGSCRRWATHEEVETWSSRAVCYSDSTSQLDARNEFKQKEEYPNEQVTHKSPGESVILFC
jgi:hypothetical protein